MGIIEKLLGCLPASRDSIRKLNEKLDCLNREEELEHIRADISKCLKLTRDVKDEVHHSYQDIQKIRNEVHHSHQDIQKVRDEVHHSHQNIQKVKDEVHDNNHRIKKISGVAGKAHNAADEAVWGLVFRDAISHSRWLENRSFYPGRWAVGYQFLYVLYRVLNEAKPKSILELGLGQSTHMITQYVAFEPAVCHRVVEHDREWITFFGREHKLSDCTEIVHLNLIREALLDDPGVLVYENFRSLADRKYDFISVDAPFGGDANIYARVDVLKLIPEYLESSFVIMVDDVNRQGEYNAVKLIETTLKEHGIAYEEGVYKGNKETRIITSEDNKFLCTL